MRKTFMAALMTGIVLSPGAAGAADRSPAASGPGAVHETRAANGLRILTREAFDRDLVALNLYVDGGNRTETAPLSGLSHYYEHLIFRGGTKKQAELETRKVFESIGQFGGWTGVDETCYNFVVPAARFDEALERFADAVMSVEVTADKVAKEREVVLSEYKMSYADSPRGWAWYKLMGAAFRRHPYGRTTIGRREVIEGAELERFKTFYAERYVPNHMVVAVVGAIPHAFAAEKVARAFGGFGAGKPTFETGEVEPPQTELRTVVEPRRTEKVYAAIGFKAPAAAAEDAYAVSVLAHILGGGESSRLEREVRAKKGLVLGASAWFDETRDPGLFGIALSIEPGKELAALAAVAEELRRLKDEEPSPDELERARVKLETDFLLGGESAIDQANRLCWFALIGDPKLGADHVEKIRAVTGAAIREAASRYLLGRAATVSLVVPEAQATPAAASPAAGTGAEGTAGAGAPPSAPTHEAIARALAPLDAGAGRGGPPPVRTVTKRLANGCFVIAREDRSAPIVAATVEFAGALAAEPPERSGLGALADRLLTRGAAGMDRERFAARLDESGVRIATGLDRDAFAGSLEAPAARFEAGLDLLAAALLSPTFAADEIEKARAEQIAEIEAIEDRSFALVGREFYAMLYGQAPYGRPVEGTVEGVRAVTRGELLAWRKAAMRPDRLVVAVVGALAPSAAIDLVERRFGSIAPVPPAEVSPPPAPPVDPAPRLLDRPREQVCFRLGHVGIRATDPDWIPLAIALRHLSSEVFFRYVYEKGMAYRAWTYLRPGLEAHPFTFEMGVSAPNFGAARDGLTATLAALRERGLTPEEVARAKAEIVSRHALSRQTDLAESGLLALYESLGLGWRRADELPALVEGTSVDAVNAALRKHLDPERLRIAAAGDLRAAGVR